MAENNAPKDRLSTLKCASCRYDLAGLATESKCPECGFSIARSRKLAEEHLSPGDQLPRIRLAMALLLASTVTGIPGILLYALFSRALRMSEASDIPEAAFWTFQGLLLAGSWAPVLTLAVLPRRAHVDGGVWIMVGWALGALVGIGLMNTPSEALFQIGSAFAVICGIINLTRANRSIGSVVPAWARMGSARQTRGPLIASVALIAVGRVVLLFTDPIHLENLGPVWVQFMVIAAESLLLIGCIYVLINRLWLFIRLWRAMALRTVTPS